MTPTPTTTTNLRATDARLHELLTGEKTYYDERGYSTTVTWGDINGAYASRDLPHYHEDANDIAHAELALTQFEREEYASKLELLVTGSSNAGASTTHLGHDDLFKIITATAAQRAHALVVVLERVRGEVGT